MAELSARRRLDALGMKLRVDRVRADLAGMKLAPELREAAVVLAAAERARAVPPSEGRRFVEEEELREASGLQQRAALSAAELEPAGDPALAVVASADPPGLVVEAAAVSVDQAARGIRDEVAERSDTVLQRHARNHRERKITDVQPETWNNCPSRLSRGRRRCRKP